MLYSNFSAIAETHLSYVKSLETQIAELKKQIESVG